MDMRNREQFRRSINRIKDEVYLLITKARYGDGEAREKLISTLAIKVYSQEEIDKLNGD